MKHEELLNDLYYKQHNYDGVDILYKKAKLIDNTIKRDLVKEWLSKQQNKQLTVVKTKKKSFLPIYSETPYSFQIDLTFFPRYKKQNQQIYVLFTAININTRYAYAYYGKDKEMITILDMLKKMEKQTVINSITCDEGTEFNNKQFKTFCHDNDIQLYFVKGDSHKLGIINRFHRTIKEKLTKYFIANDTVKWVDVIDKIIYNYKLVPQYDRRSIILKSGEIFAKRYQDKHFTCQICVCLQLENLFLIKNFIFLLRLQFQF